MHTCGSWEYCCCCCCGVAATAAVAVLGSNTESRPGKLAIDDGGGTFANWLNVGTAPATRQEKEIRNILIVYAIKYKSYLGTFFI